MSNININNISPNSNSLEGNNKDAFISSENPKMASVATKSDEDEDSIFQQQLAKAIKESKLEIEMKKQAELHGVDYINDITIGFKLQSSYELASRPPSEASKDPRGFQCKAIHQVGTINQFHPHWYELIKQFNTSSAICGYTSIAAACIIANMSEETYRDRTLQSIENALSNVEDMDREVERSMRFITEDRSRYVESHPASFPTEREAQSYKKDWVANYEISDFVRNLAPEISKHIIFVRFNQYPELKSAKHEERIRLEEEKSLEPYIIETFASSIDGITFQKDRKLNSSTAILAERGGRLGRVAIIDLNGHFAVAVPCGDECILFNTSDYNYLSTVGSITTTIASNCFTYKDTDV
jgi:hypothetical protein